MKIAKVSGEAVVEIGDYRTLFPNVSFTKNGPNDSWLAENNCKKVKVGEVIDRDTQKIVSASAYIDGDFVKTYTIESLSAEDLAAIEAAKGSAVREKRNALIAETDYLALSDNTLSAEMAAYRQALRDITDHANFPNLEENQFDENGNKVSGDWPTKP